MKPINANVGSLINGMRGTQSESGPDTAAHGKAGYANRPPRSYGLDHEPTEAPVPAVRTVRNTLPKALSMMPSPPLPELRSVVLGQTQDGSKIMAMVLARAADLPSLKSSISEMTEALAPAAPEETASLLARLFSHYPQQQSGSPMSVVQDWIEDMSGVSATALRAAVLKWRRDPHAFKPSPGQLLEVIAKIEAPLRERLDAALDILDREESMPKRERLNHLRQREYELELGMVPYDTHLAGHDEIIRYLERETALVKSEIAHVEKMEA